ncbi:MAG: peptidoglycan editing factor PgeF [Deinococcota bacterium]
MVISLSPLTAPNISVPHAFTTRAGGVSPAPYASLNLGLSSGDSEPNVAANRTRMLEAFGSTQAQCCAFHQVHSSTIVTAKPTYFELEADASITNDPSLTLIISTADCLPILFYDPIQQVVGAAHCGWRGTVAKLASKMIQRFIDDYSSTPQNIQVAIGPGISRANYQVGAEVVEAFQEAEFSDRCYEPDGTGRYTLDLVAANREVLEAAGVRNIWQNPYCTLAEPELFYSHRRDQGKTGRHWALIKLA